MLISNHKSFRVLCLIKLLPLYSLVYVKKIFIFWHWKVPANGTMSTVPIVSADFCSSLFLVTGDCFDPSGVSIRVRTGGGGCWVWTTVARSPVFYANAAAACGGFAAERRTRKRYRSTAPGARQQQRRSPGPQRSAQQQMRAMSC